MIIKIKKPVSLNEKIYVVCLTENLAYFLEDKFNFLLSCQKKKIIEQSHTGQNKSSKSNVTADLQSLFSPKALSKHEDAFPSYRWGPTR
jgi:hypothetical protein